MRSRFSLFMVTFMGFISVAQVASAKTSSIQKSLTGTYVSVSPDCEVILPGHGPVPASAGTVMTVEAGDTEIRIQIGTESVTLPVNPPPSQDAEIYIEAKYDDTGYSYRRDVIERTGLSYESFALMKSFERLDVQSGLNRFSGYDYCTFK